VAILILLLVWRAPSMLPRWETLDRPVAHHGFLTRTVADAAMMMEVMAGPDDRYPLSLPGGKLDY